MTSLVSLGGHKHEEEPAASSPVEDSEDPVSLPYWVEASHNIYKEDRGSSPAADESGYSSIAETASCASTSSTSSCSASTLPSVADPGRGGRRPGRHKEQQTASSEDIEKIEEKISEIFDSMNLGASLQCMIPIASIVSSSRS